MADKKTPARKLDPQRGIQDPREAAAKATEPPFAIPVDANNNPIDTTPPATATHLSDTDRVRLDRAFQEVRAAAESKPDPTPKATTTETRHIIGATDPEERKALEDFVREHTPGRDVIGRIDPSDFTPGELNAAVGDLAGRLEASEILGINVDDVTDQDVGHVSLDANDLLVHTELGERPGTDTPEGRLGNLVIDSALRNVGGAGSVEAEILRGVAPIGDNPFGTDPSQTSSSGGGGGKGGGDTKTDDHGSSGGRGDPNGAGDDDDIGGGFNQPRDHNERTDEQDDGPDVVTGDHDDTQQNEDTDQDDGGGGGGDTDENDDDGEDNEDNEDNEVTGDSDDGTVDLSGESDDFTVEFQGGEGHFETTDDENSDDTGDEIPPGDGDQDFHQTGRAAIEARKGLHFEIPQNNDDTDPVDPQVGQTEIGPARMVPGVKDPVGPDLEFGHGAGVGTITAPDDGVTDPGPQDDDAPGGIGPDADPFGDGSPALEESADDTTDDTDGDATNVFHIPELLDDVALDADGPDLPFAHLDD